MTSLPSRFAAALSVALVLALLTAGPAWAAVVTWNLVGVTFADGGVASGFFKFEASTSTVTDWSISVSGGNTGTFPPTTYDPMTSDVSVFNGGNPGDTISFGIGNAPSRDLRLTPSAMLTNAGGSSDLDLGAVSANVECFNCSPFRDITAGALVAAAALTSVPAPLLDARGIVALLLVLFPIARRRLLAPAQRPLA